MHYATAQAIAGTILLIRQALANIETMLVVEQQPARDEARHAVNLDKAAGDEARVCSPEEDDAISKFMDRMLNGEADGQPQE